MPTPPRLLDQVRNHLRLNHYSIRTEDACLLWLTRFTLRVFHRKRHPREMGRAEIEAFLTHLALKLHVAASTPNQALRAIFAWRACACGISTGFT